MTNPQSAIRNPQFLEGPSRPSNRISFPVAGALILSHLCLLCALGLSLHWNVQQASTKSADLTHAFTAGRVYQAIIDGANDIPEGPEPVEGDHL